jgi:Protein of unknown function (DUF2809)
MWALMLFLAVTTLLDGRRILAWAVISFALTFLIENSQLYLVLRIDPLPPTTLGGLVLGFGFLLTDLDCYAARITN